MTFKPFIHEQTTKVGGSDLTLRLDFAACCTIEGLLQSNMPSVVAHLRSAKPRVSAIGQVLWAFTRKHHPDMTLDQVAGLIFADDAALVALALSALLEPAFPLPSNDTKPAPKRRAKKKAKAAA